MTVMGMFSLTGKIALITGSSQGLGLAIARGLGQAGATVVLNGRRQGALAEAVETLRGEGITVHCSSFDVTKRDEVTSAAATVEDEIGPIDILVNNAGIHRRAPFAEMSDDQWQEVLDTNLTGVFLPSQIIGSRMVERKRGKIICIGSVMCEIERPQIANYAAAKGGVKTLIRAMTTEWAQCNIQINGIGPGYFATDLTKPLMEDPKFNSWITGRTPAGRWGQPEELVGAAVFLASTASDFVNGQMIYVDGGMLAAV